MAVARALVRQPGVTLSLVRMDVYTVGVSIQMRLDLSRVEEPEVARVSTNDLLDNRARAGRANEHVRIGVTLSDGKTAVLDLDRFPPTWSDAPTGPMLRVAGGSGHGGPGRWTTTFGVWLWPLPPNGDLVLHYASDILGVDEGSTVLHVADLATTARSVVSV